MIPLILQLQLITEAQQSLHKIMKRFTKKMNAIIIIQKGADEALKIIIIAIIDDGFGE